jgi:GAF domain-containing protein
MNDGGPVGAALRRVRLELSELAALGKVDDLLQRALDLAEPLTGSKIGFFHFVDDDQESLSLQAWSTNTLRRMCTAEGKGRHYPVTQAGLWADCFRARKPVIHNHYAALRYRRGLPPGHAAILRELTVPVFRGDKIVAIAGVGNKIEPYSDADVLIFQEVADLAMEFVAGMAPGRKSGPDDAPRG